MAKKPTRRKPRRVAPALGVLALLLAAPAAAFFLWGLPAPLLNAALSRLSPGEGRLMAGGFAYRAGQGWVLEDVEVYSNRDRVTPWLTLDRIRFRPDLLQRIRRGDWSGDIGFKGGRLATNLGFWADDLVTRQELDIRDIHGEVSFGPGALRLERVAGRVEGCRVTLRGELPARRPEAPFKEERFIRRLARHAAPVVAFLEGFEFSTAPEIRLRVRPDTNPESPVVVRLDVGFEGSGTHRGFEFTSITARAEYRNRLLTLEELEVVETPDRRLGVAGEIDFGKERLTLDLENTLHRYGLEALSPFALGKLLSRLQIRVQDRCDFTLRVGPAPFSNPGSRFGGHFEVGEAFYRDAYFPELELDLDYRDQVLRLENIEGRIGQRDASGPVGGSLLYGLDDGEFRMEIEGAFKPAAAISLVGSQAEKFIRDWEFRGPPPEFSMELSAGGRPDAMDMNLRLKATEVLCRGTLIRELEGQVKLGDREIAVTEVRASRDDEVLTGEFRAPRDLSHIDLRLDSGFHLPDLAPFIGRPMVERLRPFRFRGDSRITLEGRVDLSGEHAHDLEGRVAFTDLVYRWAQFDRLTASFDLEGEALSIPDIKGRLVEGALTAGFSSEETFSPRGLFQLDLEVESVDLFEVITAATDSETTPYTGNLDLELDVKGNLRDREGAPRMASLTGGGSVAIRGGELFRVPLLLGLSRILSRVVKGFGYASQGDFSADFDIGEGVVSSDNLFLEGRLLSIAGAGFYRFDGKIGANLKIQLLSDGLLSDALKLVLWPIRKLIEVQLTGTLDQPNWQPRNLPKELFGK